MKTLFLPLCHRNDFFPILKQHFIGPVIEISSVRSRSYLNTIWMTLRTLRASTYSSLLFESLTITFIEIIFCICSPNPTTNFETKNLKFLQKKLSSFLTSDCFWQKKITNNSSRPVKLDPKWLDLISQKNRENSDSMFPIFFFLFFTDVTHSPMISMLLKS